MCKHMWKYTRSCTRQCERCGREETLWYNRFPKVGEPQTEWGPSPDQMLKDVMEKLP